MTTILIDNREIKLYDEIISRDLETYEINIEKKQLELGDILIYNEHIKILFERKTKSDIISSIKDGRYHEQKSRLLSLEDTKVLYIFENGYILQQEPMLEGAIINTIFRDNMSILFTKNLEDTATLLLTICIRMCKKPEIFIFKPVDYSMTIKMKTKKIDNIDNKTCFILQLSQIPSISKIIANTIGLKYNSMNEFITDLNKQEDKIKYLESFEKIGNKKAKTIIEYLGIL